MSVDMPPTLCQIYSFICNEKQRGQINHWLGVELIAWWI